MSELTIFERQALEAVKDGGDVFSRGTAVLLRGLEQEGLVEICAAQGDYDGKLCLPYFGAIITAKGKEVLAKKEAKNDHAT